MSEQRIASGTMVKAAIAVYLAVQLAIPAIRLATVGGSPAHFGWQMFSRIEKQPVIRVRFPDHVDSVAVTAQRNAMRADVELPPDFPAQVCAHYPSALGVRIGDSPEVTCR